MKIDKGIDGRGLYRSIYCAIWSDADWKKFSPDEKLVFLNLRISPLSNIASIFPFWIEPVEQQTGLNRDAIVKALDTLSNAGWIAIEEGIVWIRKGLRFDPQISLQNENHVKAIKRAISALPRLQIVRDFLDFYRIKISYPIPSRSHPDPIPSRSHPPTHLDGYTDQDKGEGVRNKEKDVGKGGGEEEKPKSFFSSSKEERKEILKQQARQLGVR